MLSHRLPTGLTRIVLLSVSLFVTLAVALTALPSAADAWIFRPDQAKPKKKKKKKKRKLPKSGVFKVKVAGVQTDEWVTHKTPHFECDWFADGHGAERVRFKTPFQRMRLTTYPPKYDMAIFRPLPAKGKVTRRGVLDVRTDHLPDDCGGDGGDGPPPPPPAPDCGTKPIRDTRLSLFALSGRLRLDRTSTRVSPKDPFVNCPWKGRVWPGLLTTNKHGKTISTAFRPNLIFNPRFDRKTGKWSKVIMIGSGTQTRRDLDGSYKATIEWTVTMKRLR